jgi:protein-S-isoprenylcysteine O-methyltransferase Ste14
MLCDHSVTKSSPLLFRVSAVGRSKREGTDVWIVNYTDQRGDRHIKTFQRKKDADSYHARASKDVTAGVHIANSKASWSSTPVDVDRERRTQFVSKSIERSAYVLLTSLALMLLFRQWRPIETMVWQIDNPQIAMALTGLSFAGWLIVLASTFVINHFELFGLHQVINNLVGREMPAPRFRTPLYYQFVRHRSISASLAF